MTNPWGGVGAWALDTERAEAEEREGAKAAASDSFSGGTTILAGQPAQSFPTLKESITKPKKKKNVPISLSEFNTGTYVGPGGARREPAFESKGLTTDEMLRLPTGPRERTAEELEQSRLGGGFRSYGSGFGGDRGTGPPRRRSEFGMDEEMRRSGPAPRASDIDLPSRADEADNWATSKKFAPSMDSGRQERYGSLGSGGSSKADEVDNWSLGKKTSAPPSRNSGFGSGFRDSPVTGVDSDRWSKGVGGSLSSNGDRGRPRLILDPPKRDSGSQQESALTRPSPFGAARPREEVLAEKGMDWRKMETEIDVKKNARPSSSHSSRPSSTQSSRPGSPISQVYGDGGASKPRPKVNPFGDAKPREVLLEEKGMDWRKIDKELEHRRVDRPVTDEEKVIKEEIDHLKKELAKESENKVNNSDSAGYSTEQRSLHDLTRQREKELVQLSQELDDKARFGQKASIDVRPASGLGRTPISADRPSQSAISEDLRNIEFMERPPSQGMGDSWSRPMDERRGFQRSRDSGFFDSRSSNRSKSQERW